MASRIFIGAKEIFTWTNRLHSSKNVKTLKLFTVNLIGLKQVI